MEVASKFPISLYTFTSLVRETASELIGFLACKGYQIIRGAEFFEELQ